MTPVLPVLVCNDRCIYCHHACFDGAREVDA
jgi:wyosine [tRNA(Phe)-imidazoG37] synthetase (radical SAM superfamily)